jgi:hypothetical protein
LLVDIGEAMACHRLHARFKAVAGIHQRQESIDGVICR